jgi:hypothetical protein
MRSSGDGRYTAARLLLVCSAAGLAILWSVLWTPVLLTGGQGGLLLYPVVFLLAVGPWAGAWTALALASRSRKDGGADSRGGPVAAMSAVLLALGPVLLWFGPGIG